MAKMDDRVSCDIDMNPQLQDDEVPQMRGIKPEEIYNNDPGNFVPYGRKCVGESEPSTKSVTKNCSVGIDLCYTTCNPAESWILDSGATDHMTFEAKDLSNFTKPRRQFISNANGDLCQVAGAGTVNISPSLHLSHTLLVPSLNHKLLSISQITKDLNCFALIYPDFCLLQDIYSKEIIGRGTERDGLYYVDDLKPGRSHLAHGSAEQKIWLWHRRLGHPSFTYMKHLFPTLFAHMNIDNLKCETCIITKSHRAHFPSSLTRTDNPFSIIHTNVWGRAPVTSLSGYRWFVTFTDDCTLSRPI